MAYLKVIIAMFYFCHSENSSSTIKNIFRSTSIFPWKTIFSLKNIRNKCVIRKIR